MKPLATPLLFAAMALSFQLKVNAESADTIIFDFSKTNTPSRWEIVNDDVMGGVSSSRFVVTNGVGMFTGDVSLKFNGGFASVRSLDTPAVSKGFSSFVVRLRGDGRRYKLTARMNDAFDGPLYQAPFSTKAGEWQEVELSLKAFTASFRGRALPQEPPLDPARIRSVGFLISDKQEGPFKLEVAWIKTANVQR